MDTLELKYLMSLVQEQLDRVELELEQLEAKDIEQLALIVGELRGLRTALNIIDSYTKETT